MLGGFFRPVNFLYPKIPPRQLALMLVLAVAGGLVAGLYGIAHDQITYTLGPEYFTRMKFHQFAWSNIGLPPRLFAGEIGFLATWWVGAIVGWALARIAVPAWPPRTAIRRVALGFAVVFAFALAAGLTGFLLGHSRKADPDFSNWDGYLIPLHIRNPGDFVLVAYIHNASYLGGLIGLIVAASWLALSRETVIPHHGQRENFKK